MQYHKVQFILHLKQKNSVSYEYTKKQTALLYIWKPIKSGGKIDSATYTN